VREYNRTGDVKNEADEKNLEPCKRFNRNCSQSQVLAIRRMVNRSSLTARRGNEYKQTQERNTRARTRSSERVGRVVALEDHPFGV